MVIGQLHTSTALTRGRKSARYPRNGRLGRPGAGWTLAWTYIFTKLHGFTPQKTDLPSHRSEKPKSVTVAFVV